MRRSKWIYHFIISIAAVGIIALFMGAFTPPRHSSIKTNPLSHSLVVETIPIEKSTHYQILRSFLGQVEANRTSQIGFELSGNITQIFFDEGSNVKKGQVVAILDREKLKAKRRELVHHLHRTQADLELAKSSLKRLRRTLQTFSAQQLDEAEKNFQARKAAMLLAKSTIRTLDVDLTKTKLIAPFSGAIVKRYVDEGQIISPSQPVMLIIEKNILEARIGLTGKVLEKIKKEQTYSLFINNRKIPSQIKAILPNRQPGIRTVDVIFRLSRKAKNIRVGDLVRFGYKYNVQQSGFWLPLEAITESFRGLWSCYIAKPTSHKRYYKVTSYPLEILHKTEDHVFVSGNLKKQNKLIIKGLHRVVPGQIVKISHKLPAK